MKRNLLYVDDQPENLVVFRAAFKKYFNILDTTSASEALELLKAHEIPVLVADQRMPDMTGVELCEIVSRDYPQTIRMILTGYIDTDSMMAAINKGHVYNFITKPWDRQSLLSILLRGLDAYDLAISNTALFERLDHAERCATLGRFAAGISHEMRNQLFFLPLVEWLEARYNHDSDLMELARITRTTHERLVELTGEVMEFIRRGDETCRKTAINLGDLAREALSFARLDKAIPRDWLKLSVVAEPMVPCHKAKIQQVLFNLLKNAADAVSAKEQPEITTTVDQSDTHAMISVHDNGPGIDPAHLRLIWEPFFSTKGAQGNGLGLDLCRRIVAAHGGTITCDSSPGLGTTFTIRLPLAGNPQEADRDVPVVPAAS